MIQKLDSFWHFKFLICCMNWKPMSLRLIQNVSCHHRIKIINNNLKTFGKWWRLKTNYTQHRNSLFLSITIWNCKAFRKMMILLSNLQKKKTIICFWNQQIEVNIITTKRKLKTKSYSTYFHECVQFSLVAKPKLT